MSDEMGWEERPRRQVVLKLPPALLERLDAEARSRALGRHLFVELLLKAALDRLEPPEASVRLRPGNRPIGGVTEEALERIGAPPVEVLELPCNLAATICRSGGYEETCSGCQADGTRLVRVPLPAVSHPDDDGTDRDPGGHR